MKKIDIIEQVLMAYDRYDKEPKPFVIRMLSSFQEQLDKGFSLSSKQIQLCEEFMSWEKYIKFAPADKRKEAAVSKQAMKNYIEAYGKPAIATNTSPQIGFKQHQVKEEKPYANRYTIENTASISRADKWEAMWKED